MVKTRIALVLTAAAALLAVAPAGTALVAPKLSGPATGSAAAQLPAFKWNAVSGADTYEFEFAADPGFNSVVSQVTTKNTRAALKKVVPNGTYYWRVRAVGSAGGLGTWSATRTFEMAWTAQPALLSPSDLATITYPQDALKLKWSAVPGAAEYEVRIATDPSLGSLIWSDQNPVETAATSYALTQPLQPGTYYWGIRPLNAEGHAGKPSTVASFTWQWPSQPQNLTVTDLVPGQEIYDPQFSWDPVPGAARYEVEVNFQEDWAPGSKVCCDPISFFTKASTLGTSLSPAVVLPNNTYYWRVRALDSEDNAGVWKEGPSFTKTFANAPAVTPPSVKNLRLVHPNLVKLPEGSTTASPTVLWDHVPGASGYQVGVTPLEAAGCNWSASQSVRYDEFTTTTGWTPLGFNRGVGADPLAVPGMPPSDDMVTHLNAGEDYCVRVRPVDRASTMNGPVVLGDWTYLPANNQAAFTWSGPPAADACAPCEMTADKYLRPLMGTTTGQMPVFTWNPVPGAQSYFVVVARDPAFTNVVDYAWTQVPAYAPREGTQSVGYADESTFYYWTVLPAPNVNGSGASATVDTSPYRDFKKLGTPPTLSGPVGGAAINTPATTFEWTPVEGARRYRLEVASDPNFSSLEGDQVYVVETDSTAYTSNRTFPSDKALYWRVRADAEDGFQFVGLRWSATGTFKKQLPKPVFSPDNPTSGAEIPSFSWSPLQGALSYDIEVVETDGDKTVYKGFTTHAASFVQFTGVGKLEVRVRAIFPTSTNQRVEGPWSLPWSYTHTIPEPANPTHEAGASRLLLRWDARPAADHYRVQVSNRADFASTVENTDTQTTAFAPTLGYGYSNGGTFYWRVAAVDADRNQGDFTAARSFTLPKEFKLVASGYPVKNRYRTISFTVRNTSFQAVKSAAVRVSGAGVTARTKYTNVAGQVSFKIRPTRYPGKVAFRFSKSGYKTAYLFRSVRRP